MKKIIPLLLLSFIYLHVFGQNNSTPAMRADAIIRQMTLDEKIGQLNQYSSDWDSTGKITAEGDKETQIRQGKVGSMLNVAGVDKTRKLQELAMQSRLHIPMIFGLDVIHGFRTTFPIPLGETASWDLALIEKSAHTAATEASAYGIQWTFAPMVDIARNPRWGCVVRPVKELKGFQKIMLKKGETKQVTFTLTPKDLKFYNNEIEYINEAGDYEVFIGNSSDAGLKANFKLTL